MYHQEQRQTWPKRRYNNTMSADENYEQDFENDGSQHFANAPSRSTREEGGKSTMDILRESADEIVAEEREHAAEVLQEVAHHIDREVIQPRRIEDEDRRRDGRKSESDEEPERENRTERSRSQDSVSEHKDSDDESAADEGDPELNKEFIIACWKGESRRVDSLLRDGASYSARDRHGWTGLMWAASKGFDDIIENLVDRTENKRKRSKYVNAKDDITGWTALHVSTIACFHSTR